MIAYIAFANIAIKWIINFFSEYINILLNLNHA